MMATATAASPFTPALGRGFRARRGPTFARRRVARVSAGLFGDKKSAADAPDTPWTWEDGCAPLRKKQGELRKKVEDSALRDLLQRETLSG